MAAADQPLVRRLQLIQERTGQHLRETLADGIRRHPSTRAAAAALSAETGVDVSPDTYARWARDLGLTLRREVVTNAVA